MKLHVIGAGFGRTGTESLKQALELLGFGPCYHMFELDHHMEHVDMWNAARLGRFTDWDRLFADYKSAVDWPTCSYYKVLMEYYPQAKVILTVRDSRAWFRSAYDTIFKVDREKPIPSSENSRRRREMAAALIYEQTFHGDTENEEHCIRIYEAHNERVKRDVPDDRLLVYQVSEGWPSLCEFLEVDIPAEPFPTSNSKSEFQVRVFGTGQTITSSPTPSS